MNQSLFATFALALVLVGCDLNNNDLDNGPLPPMPSSDARYTPPPGPNSLATSQQRSHAHAGPSSQHGVYQGILPCGDCNGIDTTLTLNLNDTYVIQKVYVGSDKSPIITSGDVKWSDDGNVLELSGEDEQQNRYFVSYHQLTLIKHHSRSLNTEEQQYQLVQLP